MHFPPQSIIHNSKPRLLTLLLLLLTPALPPNWNGELAPAPSLTSNEPPPTVAALPNAGTLLPPLALCCPKIPPVAGAAAPNGLALLALLFPNSDGVSAGLAALAAPPNGLETLPLPKVDTGAEAPKEGVPLDIPLPNNGLADVVDAPNFAPSDAPAAIPKTLVPVAAPED